MQFTLTPELALVCRIKSLPPQIYYTGKSFQHSPIFISLDEAAQHQLFLKGLKKGKFEWFKSRNFLCDSSPHLWEGEVSFLAVGTQAWAEGSANLFKILCLFLTSFCHFREDWNKKIQAGFTQKTDKTEHGNKKNPVIPLCTLIYLNWQSTNTQILKKIKA